MRRVLSGLEVLPDLRLGEAVDETIARAEMELWQDGTMEEAFFAKPPPAAAGKAKAKAKGNAKAGRKKRNK